MKVREGGRERGKGGEQGERKVGEGGEGGSKEEVEAGREVKLEREADHNSTNTKGPAKSEARGPTQSIH